MPYPCAPTIPPLPGFQPALQTIPVTPVVPLDLGNIVVAPPPPVVPPVPAVPTVIAPRRVSEFTLSNPWVLFWLATLCRATYAPNGQLFSRAARAVLPADYPITFVANGPGLVPGYGIIKLPLGAIVCVSGTTNLGQWQEQILNGALTEWVAGEPPDQVIYKMASIPAYETAADAIVEAIAPPVVPNDQQILFCGHSMGGAVAQLLHAIQGSSAALRTPSRCVTFGAPKMGDYRAAGNCRVGAQVFRAYVIDTDFVPSLPPDLSVFQLAVPPALQGVSTNWATFRRPDGLYGIGQDGSIDTIPEPFLPLLVASAVIAAGLGRVLEPLNSHQPKEFVARLYNARLNEPLPPTWSAPLDLLLVNADLNQIGV